MKRSLNDKIVWVTGAGGGMGQNIAKTLSNLKMKVILSDINEDLLMETSRQCLKNTTIKPLDITNVDAVKRVAQEIKDLLRVTRECLDLGIAETKVGNRIGDIGYAIQQHAEKHGYGVVRDLVGHGLGTTMHEEPQVPNYGSRGRGKKIQNGLTIAIEPMINLGTERVVQMDDQWTIVTADGLVSAHYEHDVAVVNGKPEVLSTFKYVEEALSKKL